MLRRLAVLSLLAVVATPAVADGYPRHRHHHPVRHHYRSVVVVERDRDRDRERDRDGVVCLDKVRGLGTPWIGQNGALEAAKKDFMERVRYDHGESFLDISHARDVETRCGRVSIGEVAGQVTYRCEFIARPCKGEFRDTLKR